MRASTVLILSLVFLSVNAKGSEQETHVVMNYDSGKYVVSASEEGVLYIKCLERCMSPVAIKDNIGQTNLGIFRLNDSNNLLFTTWVGGSSYRTVVYNIDGKNTKKVLDEYANGGMDFIGSGGNNVVVRLPQFVSERDRRRVVRSWRWNNKVGRFQR